MWPQWSILKCAEKKQKSVNLQYITLGCLDDGTNESLTKSLMDSTIDAHMVFVYKLNENLLRMICQV